MLNAQLAAFLGVRALEQPIKAAMPPFNTRPDMQLFPTTVAFNALVFGPAIANATMALYDSPEMVALAAELGVRIPPYQLSAFVLKKAAKVQPLIATARARADCASGVNHAAVERLAAFVAELSALTPSDVPDLAAWHAFVGRHCPPGWESQLHFARLLPHCFGFEPATADALRAHQHESVDPKTGEAEVKSLEEFSLRWLAKGLCAYGPEGCLGDAVNLALAMLHPQPPADMSEGDLVATLGDIRRRLDAAAAGDAAALASLWVPTHLQHDGESDDTLSWLLLERVVRLRGGEPLRVLAQVSADAKLDGVAAHLAAHGNTVFRDSDSRNGDAVLKNFAFLNK